MSETHTHTDKGNTMTDPTDLSFYKLTPDQKRIALVLANAAEGANDLVRLVTTQGPRPIRETTTGAALVRKGLAKRNTDGRFYSTDEGFWIGDALRIEDRLGRIPARRQA